MSSRLRSDLFVAAHLRRCASEGVVAVLRRRGAAEAGAIFIKVDRLDGRASLYGPAPPDPMRDHDGERQFECLMRDVEPLGVEERMAREMRFDADLWFLEIEDRAGRAFLETISDG
jgi:hypothetical protein